MKIMGIDGSLTATGIVVVEWDGAGLARILDAACVRTKPDAKQRHVYQADQDGARIDQIADELWRMLEGVHLVAYEAPAGAKSATAAKALALVHGTVRTALRARGRQPIAVQRQEALRACGLAKACSKDDVVAWACERVVWTRAHLEPGYEHSAWARCMAAAKEVAQAVADALTIACTAARTPAASALLALEGAA